MKPIDIIKYLQSPCIVIVCLSLIIGCDGPKSPNREVIANDWLESMPPIIRMHTEEDEPLVSLDEWIDMGRKLNVKPALKDILRRQGIHVDPHVIGALIYIGLDKNECKDDLLLCLKSTDVIVLNESIVALALSMREDSIPYIERFLGADASLDTRITTLNSLSLVGDKKSIGLIKKAMSDQDSKVAQHASLLIEHPIKLKDLPGF